MNSAYHQQAELQKVQKGTRGIEKNFKTRMFTVAVKSVRDFTIPFDFM